MAAIPKSYKKYIAEGKAILFYSIAFAILMRVIYYLNFDLSVEVVSNGYLWKPLSLLFSNPLVSLLANSVFTAGLALLAENINTQHVFIRRRTWLPSAFLILLFSCHPSFVVISPGFISSIFFLFIIFILFASYNSEIKQIPTFKVSFMIALGSLFSPVLLAYMPIIWISLGIMRCFNFKSFLVSLLAIFIIYFPAFSFYLFSSNLEGFLAPFVSIGLSDLSNFTFLGFNIGHWIILGFSVILLSIILSDDYINRHKDKIKIRAYLSMLGLIVIFSMLFYLFFNVDIQTDLFIAITTGIALLSHFFALAERKVTVIFFYFSIIFYLAICFLPFLSL
ncbi:hypothetical protein M2451_003001 [Dysgonomonas sp. PFB1-18]|uniref:hypothetical protein n=1 Tax=unclassified Dysgonomonas TaxID=2630389 RepID=UPI002475A521|nr:MULTISPECIES: hypothetical protein [unclassified Dysgonomonas]MDH6310109.1 hypothetical protein [Dysgonomonas sp. PF1-14]MDH6340225.1 hypothetical protein [Dysgonomonas sp. PF1-16]MDH6381666.1 hypothetical protein [Dysgonomonas sp. PFB1-18]MDH6399025.1 hypothetical protein [Dysgonomonas sp. PF1-23]